MKRIVLSFLGSIFVFAGCTSSKHNQSAADFRAHAPQKTEQAAENKRYYFSYDSCNMASVKFVGWNSSSAFETVIPDQLNDDISWKYLQVEFKQGTNSLFKTYASNPIVDNLGEFSKYYVLRCKAVFFVDVPATTDVSASDTISIDNLVWSLHSDSTVNLKGIANSGVAASTVLTADVALKNTPYRVIKFFGNAPSEKAWDLVILGDGYTADEIHIESEEAFRQSKFGLQVQALVDKLFTYKPFDQFKSNINIWVVAVPSKESGTDIPRKGISKDTFYEASMGSHCVDRAPTVKHGLLALEMAAKTPFDQILMLLNSDEWGGSGGSFAVTTTNSDYINTTIHELGHSVGLLADAYHYFSDDAILSSPAQRTACVDPDEEVVGSNGPDLGGNGMHDKDYALAPDLTLNTGSAAKWYDLLTTLNIAPVYMAYATQMPTIDATNTVTFTAHFSSNFSKMIFLPATDPGTNNALVAFTKLTINGVAIPADKIHLDERTALQSTPEAPASFKFLTIDTPVPVDGEALVTITYPIEYNHDAMQFLVGDAGSFKFVSYVFDPTDIGLFQGANPSLDKVFRSSYANMMMTVGLPYDRVQERAMFNAIRGYTFPEFPGKE